MSSYFEAMRRMHPMQLGETVDGKRVVATFWEWRPEQGNVPMFRLDGETEPRALVSIISLTPRK